MGDAPEDTPHSPTRTPVRTAISRWGELGEQGLLFFFCMHVHYTRVGEKKIQNQSPSPPVLLIPCDHWFVMGEKASSPMTSPAPLRREITGGPVQQASPGAFAHLSDTQLRQGLHGLLSQTDIDPLLLLGVHLLA